MELLLRTVKTFANTSLVLHSGPIPTKYSYVAFEAIGIAVTSQDPEDFAIFVFLVRSKI